MGSARTAMCWRGEGEVGTVGRLDVERLLIPRSPACVRPASSCRQWRSETRSALLDRLGLTAGRVNPDWLIGNNCDIWRAVPWLTSPHLLWRRRSSGRTRASTSKHCVCVSCCVRPRLPPERCAPCCGLRTSYAELYALIVVAAAVGQLHDPAGIATTTIAVRCLGPTTTAPGSVGLRLMPPPLGPVR